MDSPSKDFNLDVVLSILKRRKWIAITLFSVVLTATVSLAKFLPSVYNAGSFILVEGQQIPKNYVRSTVTSGIRNRLHTISQEILSRSRLSKLIEEFDLYAGLREKEPPETVISAMRRDIGISLKSVKSRGAGGLVAFEVSYSGINPRKVMLVANRLASFYIEENLKVRERQALGTESFLENQRLQAKSRLEEYEQKVANYKRKNMGELPTQLESNLTRLSNLQNQMKLFSDALIRAKERRDTLVNEIDRVNGLSPEDLNAPDLLIAKIDKFNRTLDNLRTRYSDKYPDVIRLNRGIATLEEELNNPVDETEPQPNGSPSTPPSRSRLVRLQKHLEKLDSETNKLTSDMDKTRNTIARYQKRVENTPKRRLELMVLNRDYNSTKQLYYSLLKRQEEANLASSMEQRQKAERFRILDPAINPEKSVAPNRGRLLLVGLFLSLVMAGAGVFLVEIVDTSFHRVEDLQAFTKSPILVSIPRIVTKADRIRMYRQQGLGAVVLVLLLLLVGGGSYLLATENEELVKQFNKSTRGVRLR